MVFGGRVEPEAPGYLGSSDAGDASAAEVTPPRGVPESLISSVSERKLPGDEERVTRYFRKSRKELYQDKLRKFYEDYSVDKIRSRERSHEAFKNSFDYPLSMPRGSQSPARSSDDLRRSGPSRQGNYSYLEEDGNRIEEGESHGLFLSKKALRTEDRGSRVEGLHGHSAHK